MAQNGKKSIFKLPPVLTLLFMMMIFCAIMSWIVPAGEFDTEKVGRMTKVVAGTYHAVPATPVGPWQLLKALPEGFYLAGCVILAWLIRASAQGTSAFIYFQF